MDNTKILNRDFEKVAWGMLLIWWGILGLADFFPHGTGAFGVGLIILGVNLARSFKGIPTNIFSITLGAIALVWGGSGAYAHGLGLAAGAAWIRDFIDRTRRILAGA